DELMKTIMTILLGLAATACMQEERSAQPSANAPEEDQLNRLSDPDVTDPMGDVFARAELRGTTDENISGSVAFHQDQNDQLIVTVRLNGVPEGEHGFHIHENGSCDNAGEAAGGHYGGHSTQHGAPEDPN